MSVRIRGCGGRIIGDGIFRLAVLLVICCGYRIGTVSFIIILVLFRVGGLIIIVCI